MKLVIDIPEAVYKMCKEWKEFNMSTRLENIIANGTPYEERPKGEWIERVEHRGCYLGVKTVYSYTCPFCGVKEYEKHPFCHCGADMRGEL